VALTPVHLPAGAVLIRQGEPGDAYYAIAAGELDVLRDGRSLLRCGRGEGVGEIALLRAIPRTATVIAHTAATVYELDREPFPDGRARACAHPAAGRPHRRGAPGGRHRAGPQ
jgi:CRP-like cAMP-binding protein